MPRDVSFRQLVEVCLEHGRDQVIAKLEHYHRTMEGLQAHLYSDPETVHKAALMSVRLVRQAITLGRLKRMDEAQMRAFLARSPRPRRSRAVPSTPLTRSTT